MLVVPFAYDQPDNAARLVRLGVARTIGSGSYTSARSAKDLRKLLTDPMYQTNSDRIARIVNAEDGVGAACDEFGELRISLNRCAGFSCLNFWINRGSRVGFARR
jgi:rhamnosyltransferase subunit B